VDEELLELMARAGCNGIFFGVETGSSRMQRIIGKDLDLAEARRAVEIADRLGMDNTVSMITGFPEETEDDQRQTLGVLMHAMRHRNAVPQLNLLAPLAGTPVHEQYRDRLVLEEIGSRLSCPGLNQSDPDRELIRRHPAIFPNFYLLPTAHLDRAELQELAEFLPAGRKKLRWLLAAIHRRRPDFLELFREWRRHRIVLHPSMTGSGLRLYYTRGSWSEDFVAFVRGRIGEFGDPAVEALVHCEESLSRAAFAAPSMPAGLPVAPRIGSATIPVCAPGVHVIELPYDLQNVVDSVKGVAHFASARVSKYYRTQPSPDEVRLIEITPLIAQALLMCDGMHSVADLGELFESENGLRGYAARRLAKCLRDGEMIEVYRAASRQRRASAST
jgi:hypothetical protein